MSMASVAMVEGLNNMAVRRAGGRSRNMLDLQAAGVSMEADRSLDQIRPSAVAPMAAKMPAP